MTAHTGTIPSKTLREAVLFLSGWRQRGFYGQSYRVKSDIRMADLMHRLQATVSRQIEIIRHQLLRNGVTVINGEAAFLDGNRLRVTALDGKESVVRGEHIVIATGTIPHRPDDIPFDDERIIDSDGILGMPEIPRSMTVIGAGVIGVEYATIFGALDTRITLVDGREQLLDFVDRDVSDEFRHQLQSRDILLRLGEQVNTVERDADGSVITHLASGKRLRSEMLMVAAGRIGATARLALEQNRDVFAVPGSVWSEVSRGCHALLRDGAWLLERPDDLFDVLPELGDGRSRRGAATVIAREPHDPEAAAVLTALGFDARPFEALRTALDWPAARLRAVLTGLELDGFVRQQSGRYIRDPAQAPAASARRPGRPSVA